MHHSSKTKERVSLDNIKADTVMIMTALHLHVHILFGLLNVSLDLRCNVKTQFLRCSQGNHGRTHYFGFPPVEKM